jgi:hypothetical protein
MDLAHIRRAQAQAWLNVANLSRVWKTHLARLLQHRRADRTHLCWDMALAGFIQGKPAALWRPRLWPSSTRLGRIITENACMHITEGSTLLRNKGHVRCRPMETVRSIWCASSKEVEHSCKSPVACHAQDTRWLEGTPQHVCALHAHAASSLVANRLSQQLPQENIKSQMPDLHTGATAAATLRLTDCNHPVSLIRTRSVPTKAVWGQRYRGTDTWLPNEPRLGRPGRCKPTFGRTEISFGQFGCNSMGVRSVYGLFWEACVEADPLRPATCCLPSDAAAQLRCGSQHARTSTTYPLMA